MYYQRSIVGIYKITHRASGMSYIGMSVNIMKRWGQHCNFAEAKDRWQSIKTAIHHHGVPAFVFEVIEECDKKDLRKREKFWIKVHDTVHPKGFNMNAGSK